MAHLAHRHFCGSNGDDDIKNETPSPPISIRLHCPSPASSPPQPRASYSRPSPASKQTQGSRVSSSGGVSPHPVLPDQTKLDPIISRVIAFLSAQRYSDLVIPDITAQTATQVVQYFNRVTRVPKWYPNLPPKLLERFRYTYDTATATLAIRGMPTHSHDTLAQFFGSVDFFIQLLNNPGAFTSAERLCIKSWVSNVPLPGSSKRASDGSNKLGRREKIGDFALVYEPKDQNEEESVFPHVVMEVGFSQAYDKKKQGVLADVREWLVATKGGVQLAVLLKIEEGEVPGKAIQGVEGSSPFGDNNNNDEADTPCDDDDDDEQEARMEDEAAKQSDSCSEPEDYRRMFKDMRIDADNWIGKYTVFMETWVYDATTGGISVKQPRQYLMIDNVPTMPMPSLTFTRSTFDLPDLHDVHDNEEFHIDLTPYVASLLKSRVRDAFRRKTLWVSKRKQKRRHADRDDARDCDFVEAVAARMRPSGEGQQGDADADTVQETGRRASTRVVKRCKRD